MGDLFSLFWEADPPPIPLSLTIPNQDCECQKDDPCGAIGSFLLWYFVIILVVMFFSRASLWMSDKDKDNGTSTSLSKASRDTSCKRQSKDGSWDSLQMMKKPKQSELTPVTDSEVALVNTSPERRLARCHSLISQVNQNQPDSDTTDWDSEESNWGASSWKESESEHDPSPASIKKKKKAQRPRNVASYQKRERLCLHCKAVRTDEWLTRHFLQNTSLTPVKGHTQKDNSVPEINIECSKF
ncbi:serine-rich single-pass membrane protein 1 isoform X1 [Manis javanica]|uniref:serine-rich single-pass membrane protein 1 isoform X1 n=1 Tax=Manis javanica TaxID=9974 RepID=UPI0018792A54|nr:serine-rich single-pass membrane protein 1 isoform X2 [Manis javanica]